MRKLNRLYAVLMAGGVVAMAGCNESRDTGTVTSRSGGETARAPAAEAVEERDNALVRFVNAIPGGKSVTVFAGDSAAFRDVSYKKATGYREVPDDFFAFTLRPSSNPNAEPLAENREKLADGGHYTIVAMLDEGGADKRNLRVLDDDLKPIDANKARIRVIHAVAGADEVSLYARGNEDALFDGINFKSEAGWKDVDPMTGTLEIRPEGKKVALATLPNTKLEGGKSYTFVVTGRPAKLEIVKIEDAVAEAGQS